MLLAIPKQSPVHSHNIIDRFAGMLFAITRASSHSYERGVHDLLVDLMECRRAGQLDEAEYYTIIGKAADVADYFNYDIELLRNESNGWYRASVIHQMGQGMLQALERMRPDLIRSTIFSDAMNGLHFCSTAVSGHSGAVPLTCRQWASDIGIAGKNRSGFKLVSG